MSRSRPDVVRTVSEFQPWHGGILVPTMGALHEGHASLIRSAVELGSPTVVSIFVNPSQFGPGEDYDRYPRDLDHDLSVCAEAGADVVFAPSVDEMYPEGQSSQSPPLPPVATEPGLEDACRPGHFEGVCQVVARLFDVMLPRVAVFGQKDYQQLQVLRAMVASEQASVDRWPSLEIVGEPTVREPDGLAMSSRNRYLSADQRDLALGLFRALRSAHAAQHPLTAESIMRSELEAHELSIDYATVRDAATLMPVSDFERPTRGLIAARLGDVRLIDNMAMTVWR